jgi:glycine/D-amino acid oxidase-like deaminating enzyme
MQTSIPSSASRPVGDPGSRARRRVSGEAARLRRLVERDMATLRPGEQRGWWLREALAADPGEPCPPLRWDATADVVIVGGGYTGLWTAWQLLEQSPDLRIVLLEADIVGGGASGRNGGFLTAWWDALPTLVARFGQDGGRAIAEAVGEAPGAVADWAAVNDVDAWVVPAGSILAATSPAQDGGWHGITQAARDLGEAHRFVELTAAQVQARCNSPVLGGGLLVPSDATVHPARLARGLRRVLLERGVAIHEGTRVASLRQEGDRVVARTADGATVIAAQAVLGVNAWAAGWPGGGFGSRMITWSSYMVVTEPMPDRLREIGWTGGESISDLRFTNHYFRTTNDGRIAFGGGGGRAGYGGRMGDWVERDRGSAALAARGFRRIFPMLDDVRLDDAWGGPIDISPDHLPAFGTLPGGRVHFGHGFSGTGVGPTWLGGRILAALAQGRLDDPATRLGLVGNQPRRFPPEPFRFLGARVIREAIVEAEQRDDLGWRVPPPLRWLIRLPRAMGYDLGPE